MPSSLRTSWIFCWTVEASFCSTSSILFIHPWSPCLSRLCPCTYLVDKRIHTIRRTARTSMVLFQMAMMCKCICLYSCIFASCCHIWLRSDLFLDFLVTVVTWNKSEDDNRRPGSRNFRQGWVGPSFRGKLTSKMKIEQYESVNVHCLSIRGVCHTTLIVFLSIIFSWFSRERFRNG